MPRSRRPYPYVWLWVLQQGCQAAPGQLLHDGPPHLCTGPSIPEVGGGLRAWQCAANTPGHRHRVEKACTRPANLPGVARTSRTPRTLRLAGRHACHTWRAPEGYAGQAPHAVEPQQLVHGLRQRYKALHSARCQHRLLRGGGNPSTCWVCPTGRQAGRCKAASIGKQPGPMPRCCLRGMPSPLLASVNTPMRPLARHARAPHLDRGAVHCEVGQRCCRLPGHCHILRRLLRQPQQGPSHVHVAQVGPAGRAGGVACSSKRDGPGNCPKSQFCLSKNLAASGWDNPGHAARAAHSSTAPCPPLHTSTHPSPTHLSRLVLRERLRMQRHAAARSGGQGSASAAASCGSTRHSTSCRRLASALAHSRPSARSAPSYRTHTEVYH